jgi:hypothetical protein
MEFKAECKYIACQSVVRLKTRASLDSCIYLTGKDIEKLASNYQMPARCPIYAKA